MSALARYFKSLGKNVLGYDKTETKLTKKLQEEGIAIQFEDGITKEISALDKAETLVIRQRLRNCRFWIILISRDFQF